MLEAFKRVFRPDAQTFGGEARLAEVADPELRRLFLDDAGGRSFNGGLYRTINAANHAEWTKRVLLAFPEYNGRIACFGFDWLGRAFALDNDRTEDGRRGVLMFEPGTGEVLEIPANVESFHETELIEEAEAALATTFYADWRAHGGEAPAYGQCVGYRVPLFLGGVDGVENLELSDLGVYWHLMGQLIVQTRDLPDGTPLGSIGPS